GGALMYRITFPSRTSPCPGPRAPAAAIHRVSIRSLTRRTLPGARTRRPSKTSVNAGRLFMIRHGSTSPGQESQAHIGRRVCRVRGRTGTILEKRCQMFEMRLHTAAVVAILLRLPTALPALAEQRMVSVGERRIAIYCDGEPARFPAVILVPAGGRTAKDWETVQPEVADRKSTRLNSSHQIISYAVFCLKKKKRL